MLKVDFCTYFNFEPLRVNFAGWDDEGAIFFLGEGVKKCQKCGGHLGGES